MIKPISRAALSAALLLSFPLFAAAQTNPLGLGETLIADVAERVTPAVVSITTERVQATARADGEPLFREFFGPRGPGPRREVGAGSGVVIAADGYIVTNNHVVEHAEQIRVILADKREFDGKLVGTDKSSDLALVKIEAKQLKYLSLGDSAALRLGEFVLAIGNPFGVGQTVTMGIVSAKGRANIGIVDYEDFIQTDAAINPGNSGGALVNLKGELIGVNTAILSRSGGAQGIGFAVPSSMVEPVLAQLRKHGRVRRGWLGVAIQDLTPDLAASLDLGGTAGVLVSDIMRNGPAAKGALEAGDVIVAVEGRPTRSAAQLRNAIALTLPGTKTSLNVMRAGKPRTVSIVLAEKDDSGDAAPQAAPAKDILSGLALQDLTRPIREQLRLPGDVNGVVVAGVEPGSLAEEAGLRQGDVITRINNRTEVESLKQLEQSGIRGQNGLLLRVWRQGHFIYIVLKR